MFQSHTIIEREAQKCPNKNAMLLGDSFKALAPQSYHKRSSKQTGKISISRTGIWYVKYSNTLYSFGVMHGEEEEEKEQNEIFMFVLLALVKG